MKRTNSIFILLAFLLVCLLPASGQAYVQLDDKLYNQLFNGASKSTYNTGAVLIYRGWNKTVGYKTEMIKAIPHMNIVNRLARPCKSPAQPACSTFPTWPAKSR